MEGIDHAGLGGPQVPFDLGPALFEGVEVGRVGWQIEQLSAALLDLLPHLRVLVGGEIVHHHDLPGLQAWAQYLFQIRQKDLAVGGRFDGHGGHPTIGGHGSEQRQSAPVAGWCTLSDPLAALGTPIATCHLGSHSTLVQKHQAARIDPHDPLPPALASLPALIAILLPGVQRFFYASAPVGGAHPTIAFG
jgi:hypothetical protein